MPRSHSASLSSSTDSSRAVLDFIHRLLAGQHSEEPALDTVLRELATAYSASAAGLATYPEGILLSVQPASPGASPAPGATPWQEECERLEDLFQTRRVVTISRGEGGSSLLTVLGTSCCGGWLLWVEDPRRAGWTESEASALTLVGQTITDQLRQEGNSPRWAEQLSRSLRRQRLEAAARIVRRLAHDFGNVLTGILGFSELALTQQIAPSSPLHAYITELHRGAQNGAQYTNQLRLFARRQATGQRSCRLSAVLSEAEKRLRASLSTDVKWTVDIPPDLPEVAVDGEPLCQVFDIILENAREAISGPGTISISVHKTEVTASEAHHLFGDVRAGSHLEIRVTDTGCGLTPDAQRQLFAEPFFTTKPRKRGFGLTMAYGILSAHRGGLELLCRKEGGTVARIVLPVVSVAASVATPASAIAPSQAMNARERVLVVDDDPMIRQLVATTLERAGYRVEVVGSAREAMSAYGHSGSDPFGLIVSDVLMPEVDGVELARSLLAQNENVSILFISGQRPDECLQRAFAPGRFDLLPKPFLPEDLIRAVRAAIDRKAAPAEIAPGSNKLRNPVGT